MRTRLQLVLVNVRWGHCRTQVPTHGTVITRLSLSTLRPAQLDPFTPPWRSIHSRDNKRPGFLHPNRISDDTCSTARLPKILSLPNPKGILPSYICFPILYTPNPSPSRRLTSSPISVKLPVGYKGTNGTRGANVPNALPTASHVLFQSRFHVDDAPLPAPPSSTPHPPRTSCASFFHAHRCFRLSHAPLFNCSCSPSFQLALPRIIANLSFHHPMPSRITTLSSPRPSIGHFPSAARCVSS